MLDVLKTNLVGKLGRIVNSCRRLFEHLIYPGHKRRRLQIELALRICAIKSEVVKVCDLLR
jgi:hypothetical protein